MLMKLSDELIARYVEGKTTLEERREVRRYLCLHPEEMENILFLMDDDVDDYLNEWSAEDDGLHDGSETSFSDISLSAAAFAPGQNTKKPAKSELKKVLQNGCFIQSRLNQMLKDIKNL